MNVRETYRDRRILFVGSTGFVGKVALSMLLHRFPEVGKVFVLVRPGAGSTSEQRFFGKVVPSPVFDPLRDQHGDRTEAFLREKVLPLAGDAARPDLNFTAEDMARLGKLDAIINCAGLVSFSPSLETALRINTMGVKHVREVARKTGAAVIHVSTCFVAGNRPSDDAEIWEDDPAGYYPRRTELRYQDFHVDAEIADCDRIIAQEKALADDRAHISMFRDRAAKRLREEGRDPDDEKNLRLSVARERKLWISERLTAVGMERAQHWGWPNIYTYTKSLGDQVLASQNDVRWALVRPSIVESALRYPMVGWNEGFTTSAPLAYLAMKGHRTYPSHKKALLDVVPVDLVAAAIVGATAAAISGVERGVYHAATSDSSPLPVPRAIELTGLYARKHWLDREAGNALWNKLRSRFEAVPASKTRYTALSAPAIRGVAQSLSKLIDVALPRWGAPRLAELAAGAKDRLRDLETVATRIDDAFQLFMPFIHDNHYVFRADRTRALFASMTEDDRADLPWDPETIEWRAYWLDLHMPGLKRWVFPSLEEEFRPKPRSVYTYKDLLELFTATTKLHRSRTAFRLLPPPGSDEPVVRYTYKQVGERVRRAAAALAGRGLEAGGCVVLASENRPEWGIAYFGILMAGGVVVPVDGNATRAEIENVARTARATHLLVSERVAKRLGPLENAFLVEDLAVARPEGAAPEVTVKGDDLASLIFTSGTTGTPKGVMLTHKNFTSLLAKLVAVFDLKARDRMLSVLPLHHTFEFTAGFLMPFMRGAQITYLDDITPEDLEAAFEEGDVTAMIGVPALFQLLHRKIRKSVGDKGPWLSELFDAAIEASRRFREKTGVNVGKLVFAPVQKRLGGRIRLMVSGGSALPPDVLEAFRGLGFDLYEGYGLSEASPVLTVARPGSPVVSGSVGEPLPGIEIKIDNPDANGVGEILAQGPNVMLGYFENADATAETIEGGWLRTGDLGRLDEERRLFIVGRKKEIILAANGENVYPDELEELYGDSPHVKELSIVGLPDDGAAGEIVACLLVPEYGKESRADVRARVLEHVKQVSTKLPHWKRVKVLHMWDRDLPRTATRKVKRTLVVEELVKLQRAAARGASAGDTGGDGSWVVDLVAGVSGRPRTGLHMSSRLDEIGFDSLMYAELGVALEAAGVSVREEDLANGIGTIAELARLVEARRKKNAFAAPVASSDDDENLYVPSFLARAGRRALSIGQKLTYDKVFDVKVTGSAYLPQRAPFLVAANHASHLDLGLVKHALGDWGDLVVAVAAKDYFFEDRLKRAWFENFTNLVPMDRQGALRESLRLAAAILKEGRILLIFPEGTRSPTGVMTDFKPSIGYLALQNQVDIVPMFLEGTFDAMPKGSVLPTKRKMAAHIGPPITYDTLRTRTLGASRSEVYREAARIVEEAVRRLDPDAPPPPLQSRDKLLGTGHKSLGEEKV